MTEKDIRDITHRDLLDVEPEERAQFVERYLVRTIASLSQGPASEADAAMRLSDLGFDSLQVVELKFALDQLLGQELDVGIMIANPTVRELAEQGLQACGL